METGGVRALPMIGLALAIGILSLGFIFRVCNVKVDDSDRKTKKRKQSDDSVVGNTPSVSAIGGKYEVFLSFRSKDTGKGFTGFLYNDLVDAGIRTYLDDEELRVGEEIGPELMKAIEESKICIPILSQNYASSKWCLLELARMVECKRSTKQNIKPIFYYVEPHDVQNQTGSYKEAFRQHEQRFDKETVQRWKEALEVVGGLKGWDLKKDTNEHQVKLVTIVVEEVLSQLKKNYMVVTDNLVGIDHHIGEMKRLLNVDSNDVLRIVGICGMGGLGKTTIAKFVYNKLCECFDCCCFLADVRETSQHYNGLVNLQKQLISKIRKGKSPDIANVYEGINMIEEMDCKKKVLIVLDDVDDKSQFDNLVGKCDWFGPGSRIIVTTRNKGVLELIEGYEAYEPQPMKPDDALQLFCKCAFRENSPPKDYDILSKDIVSTTGRLPLALVIIGSYLYGQVKKIWEETLEKLNDKPNDKVQEILKISYDALNYKEKQIFLDIACFFTGENKTLPSYMWKDCKYYPESGINILVQRSLVKIGDDNEFRMHDQLRDLGREIVCQENIDDPGERSRLWRIDEALKILKGRKGTNKVEALSLQTYSGKHTFTNDEFGKLPNLRFLRMYRTDLTGDFNNLLSELICLQWRKCTDNSKPNNFHLKNLLILDLSDSYITENFFWEVWSQIKMAKKLEVLDLSYCEGLTRTPDLSDLVMLKELVLHGCCKLVEVRGLTGLKSLENLDMSLCTSLERLHNLSNLVMLKRLDLRECDKLVEVRGLVGLKSLENLDMSSCTSLKSLPELSNLEMLKVLDLYECIELVEVRGLAGLKSLENLDMMLCTSLERLPDLSNMGMLKILDLSRCKKLAEVGGLGGLKSLEILNMSWCNLLERLLDLSNLKNLKKLEIRGWKNLTKVQGLEELKSLEILDISDCKLLEKSLDLSNLQKLKKLQAGGCENLPEIRGLEELESLEILDISDCKLLEKSLDLSNLQKLKSFYANGCENLPEIQGFEELESLEILDISDCRKLKLLDLSSLQKLKELKAPWCENLHEIRGLEELESLEILDISDCRLLKESPNLSNFQKMEILKDAERGAYEKLRALAEFHQRWNV